MPLPASNSSSPPIAPRDWRRVLTDVVPNLAVFGVLALGFFVGHKTGWKVPHGWSLSAPTIAPADDWCPEHLVPESACVECNEKLLPKLPEFGFCRIHGVAECVIDHPELAQVEGTPHLPRYDTAQALALMSRPQNDPKDTLHLRRVQLATEETAKKAGINVDVVRERPMTDAVVANGEVSFDPARVAHLSSRLQGTVAAVFKQVNDGVEPGEILALVDAAQVGQAKTQLLNTVVKRELRRTTFERLRTHSISVPAASLTEAEAAYQESEIAFVSARQALVNLGFEMVDSFDGRDAKKLAEEIRYLGIPPAMLAALPAETKTANLLPLKTPYAGVIVASDIVAGEVVDATRLLFTVADPRSLWLMLSVRQEDARYIRPGLPVEFHTDNGTQDVRGTVSWLSPTIDERSRTLRVCVVLGNSDLRLRDKSFGTARILLRSEPHAIVVKREALQSTAGSQFVFVRDKDYLKADHPKVFHVRQVRTGASDDEYVELLAGVLPGEIVAISGSPALLAQLLRSSLGEGCGCGK
jgi:cobalt-zinc-cadmium efflux system membrane fusion protein